MNFSHKKLTELRDFSKTKTINDISYSVRCIKVNKSEVNDVSQIGSYDIQLSMFIKDSEGDKVSKLINAKQDFSKLLVYANTEMVKDCKLIFENDTVSCKLLHLEPSNSINPTIRLSMLFSVMKEYTDGFQFVYDDNLFNNGFIKFSK